MAKYLDLTGLSHLVDKIKALITVKDVTLDDESIVENGVAAIPSEEAEEVDIEEVEEVEITVPTKTSDLINDSGFLTSHQSLAAYRTSADQDTIDATKQSDVALSVVNGELCITYNE